MPNSLVQLATLVLLLALSAPARAQDNPVVVVTPGSARSFKAAVQTFADRSVLADSQRVVRLRDEVARGLEYSNVFEALPMAAFLGPEATVSLDDDSVRCSDWSQIGADALVQGSIAVDTELRVEFRAWDTARCKVVASKRYRQPKSSDLTILAKRIADDVVEAFIGLRGVASTELAFVSNRTGSSEVFVMGADGSHPRPATSNRSINNFPSWSPDGDAILYTSYRHQGRPLLFVSSRGRGRPGRLLPRLDGTGSEFRGVFSPLGGSLALVLSRQGHAADIYTVGVDGRKLRQLTGGGSIEVSPAWSPDGKRIAFVSDRGGSPQIYLMDADGSNQRRLSYQGNYNTHPAWSPDGSWIAYESRVGGQFDIWLIDPEGTVNLPIVSHPRGDEAPCWAPNGRKLAFSSKRRGRADIYVVDIGGENLRRITQGAGDNTAPSWGPFPR